MSPVVASARGRHQSSRTRAQTYAMLRAELDEGFAVNQSARHLGISSSYARAVLSDPEGNRDRARKEANRGTCTECGRATTGSDGKANAPTVCGHCNSRVNQGKWTPENTIETIQKLAAAIGEPPRAAYLLHRRYDHLDLEDLPGSLHSLTQTMQTLFGSFNNAIAAAGFTPRESGATTRIRRSMETTISPQELSRTHNCKTENCPNTSASPVGRHAYCPACQTRRAALRIAEASETPPPAPTPLPPPTRTPQSIQPLTPRSNPLTTHEARCKELVQTARALDRAERQLKTARARVDVCRRTHREALAALTGT